MEIVCSEGAEVSTHGLLEFTFSSSNNNKKELFWQLLFFFPVKMIVSYYQYLIASLNCWEMI